MAIYDCKTWLQDKVSVVQSSFQIEDSFLCKSEISWDENENIVRSKMLKPGGKHVLAVDLAPEVSIVLSIIPHLI